MKTTVFRDLVGFLSTRPLAPVLQSSVVLSGGTKISWSEYGRVDPQLAEKTIIYFHGTPMCKHAPNLHGVKKLWNSPNIIDPYLTRNVRLCSIERPGFGDSRVLFNRKVVDFAKDINEVISKEMNIPSQSKVYVMGFSAGGPYALALHHLAPARIRACTVIAGTVSAHNDTAYLRSARGRMESLFFSLPLPLQTLCYRAVIGGAWTGLSLADMLLRVKLGRNLAARSLAIDADMVDAMSAKIESIKLVVGEGVKNGYLGVAVDTLTNMSAQHPWGFDLTGSSDLPPVVLFYSKNDWIVPGSAGVRLAAKLGMREQVRWITGGHGCFFLHLEEILDTLLEL